MSVTFVSRLVAGVPLGELWREGHEEFTATRYHPETGKPYEATLHRKVVRFLGEVVPDGECYPDEFFEARGLSIFGDGEAGARVVGLAAARGGRGYGEDACVAVSLAEVDKVRQSAWDKLKALGYAGEVRLHLVSQVV